MIQLALQSSLFHRLTRSMPPEWILYIFLFVDHPGTALSVVGTASSIGDHCPPLVRSWSVLSSRFGSYRHHVAFTDLVWKAFWYLQVSDGKKC